MFVDVFVAPFVKDSIVRSMESSSPLDTSELTVVEICSFIIESISVAGTFTVLSSSVLHSLVFISRPL